MIAQASTWWRARTPREKLLLRICAALAFLIVLPLGLFNAAAGFRGQAAAALASAKTDLDSVRSLAKQASRNGQQPLPANDGSVRGLTAAAAQAHGLTIERIETVDGDRLRLALAPASAAAVYQWLGALARRGIGASRTVITRAGDGDLVRAAFDVGRAGG